MNIYELLDTIRRRPGMYFGYHSPTHLHSFISGYYFTNHPDESDSTISPPFHSFHDWVAAKLGYYESTSGWAYMIEDQREDKEEALWLFFQLLDEFRGFRPRTLAAIRYDKKDAINRRLYTRYRKARGTLEPVEKPCPQYLTIEEVLPKREWVVLLAKDVEGKLLDCRPCDTVGQAIERASEIFGVHAQEWKIANARTD